MSALKEANQRILQLILERDKWRAVAEERVALRYEVEILLGFDPGETYEPGKFEEAVKRLRALVRGKKR